MRKSAKRHGRRRAIQGGLVSFLLASLMFGMGKTAAAPTPSDTAFFTTPYLPNLKNVTSVLLESFDDTKEVAGFSSTLQLSQGAALSDVPASERPALESPDAPDRPAPLPLGADDWKGAWGVEPPKPPEAGGH